MRYKLTIKTGPWWNRKRTVKYVYNPVDLNRELLHNHTTSIEAGGFNRLIIKLERMLDDVLED